MYISATSKKYRDFLQKAHIDLKTSTLTLRKEITDSINSKYSSKLFGKIEQSAWGKGQMRFDNFIKAPPVTDLETIVNKFNTDIADKENAAKETNGVFAAPQTLPPSLLQLYTFQNIAIIESEQLGLDNEIQQFLKKTITQFIEIKNVIRSQIAQFLSKSLVLRTDNGKQRSGDLLGAVRKTYVMQFQEAIPVILAKSDPSKEIDIAGFIQMIYNCLQSTTPRAFQTNLIELQKVVEFGPLIGQVKNSMSLILSEAVKEGKDFEDTRLEAKNRYRYVESACKIVSTKSWVKEISSEVIIQAEKKRAQEEASKGQLVIDKVGDSESDIQGTVKSGRKKVRIPIKVNKNNLIHFKKFHGPDFEVQIGDLNFIELSIPTIHLPNFYKIFGFGMSKKQLSDVATKMGNQTLIDLVNATEDNEIQPFDGENTGDKRANFQGDDQEFNICRDNLIKYYKTRLCVLLKILLKYRANKVQINQETIIKYTFARIFDLLHYCNDCFPDNALKIPEAEATDELERYEKYMKRRTILIDDLKRVLNVAGSTYISTEPSPNKKYHLFARIHPNFSNKICDYIGIENKLPGNDKNDYKTQMETFGRIKLTNEDGIAFENLKDVFTGDNKKRYQNLTDEDTAESKRITDENTRKEEEADLAKRAMAQRDPIAINPQTVPGGEVGGLSAPATDGWGAPRSEQSVTQRDAARRIATQSQIGKTYRGPTGQTFLQSDKIGGGKKRSRNKRKRGRNLQTKNGQRSRNRNGKRNRGNRNSKKL